MIDSGIAHHPDLKIDEGKGFSAFTALKGKKGHWKDALNDDTGHGTQ